MKVERYQKKPIEVSAVQVTDQNVNDVAAWCGGTAVNMMLPVNPPIHVSEIHIKTLEGIMAAQPGDWVIRGIKGEFYPCRGDIFEITYQHIPAGETS